MLPKVKKVKKIAIMNPQSPMRFVMNAFLPAEAFFSSVNQKEINRYEQAPTPSYRSCKKCFWAFFRNAIPYWEQRNTFIILGTLAITGPDGIPSRICSIMVQDSRTSCRRTQNRANESPSGCVHTFQSNSLWTSPTPPCIAVWFFFPPVAD